LEIYEEKEKKRERKGRKREDWFSCLTIHTQFKTEKQRTFGKEAIIFEEHSQVWFVRFRFSYGSWSLKFVNLVFLSCCGVFFISSSFYFHIKIKKIKKEVLLLFMTFYFYSYFLNNKKIHLPSSIHYSLYFVLPKPLQKQPQNNLRRHPPFFPCQHRRTAAAAPLRRRRCRFGLVDLTWVWSKVVVA